MSGGQIIESKIEGIGVEDFGLIPDASQHRRSGRLAEYADGPRIGFEKTTAWTGFSRMPAR
jgi:hypothetical protein